MYGPGACLDPLKPAADPWKDTAVKSPQSGDGACRDTLPPEGMVREKAQEFIQQIMEEEVTELLATVCELKL